MQATRTELESRRLQEQLADYVQVNEELLAKCQRLSTECAQLHHADTQLQDKARTLSCLAHAFDREGHRRRCRWDGAGG